MTSRTRRRDQEQRVTFLAFMSSPPGRVLRIAAGTAMIAAGATLGGGWWTLAALGPLPLLTGAVGICPVTMLANRRSRLRKHG
ncbi:YgaP-like transmembrane domain [Embleya sp. NPDC056575]|uniref:YgaP-like transmembrane domain n=1 Tax=unclassified Embleya TaxID=2699296 RepID=UPI00369351AD